MELPAYFLSDLHLGCKHPLALADREAKVIQLLRSWQGKASHVVLVGDIFEFWMEYQHYVNRHHFHFLRALAELVESGVEVHVISGNHDFRYDEFFPKTLGVQVHRTCLMSIQGKRLFFIHGDGVAKSDWAYRLASSIIHSPADVWLFRLLHPDWGMALAQWVGSTSRKAKQNMHYQPAEYTEFVRNALRTQHCDAVVHGHNHDGGIFQYAEGTHVNCGQWLFKLGYVEMRSGEFSYHTVQSTFP